MRALFVLSVLLALPLAGGCDPTTTLPDGNAQTYVGTFVGGASGAVSVTVDGSTATGTFSVAARTMLPALSGSYNPTTGALTLSGGGYTFTGTLVNGVLSGTWTGPGGTSGTFAANLNGTGADAVVVYCGTYDTANHDGTFNLVRRGTSLRGFAVNANDGRTTDLSGTVNGNAFSMWPTASPQQQGVATGTISANGQSVSGTVNDPQNPGTFEGAVCTP